MKIIMKITMKIIMKIIMQILIVIILLLIEEVVQEWGGVSPCVGEVAVRGGDNNVRCELNLEDSGGRDIVGRPGTRRVNLGRRNCRR
jgi:hypothetical protein